MAWLVSRFIGLLFQWACVSLFVRVSLFMYANFFVRVRACLFVCVFDCLFICLLVC